MENSVEIAKTWIGTPYHHHERVKGVGVDCAMLLCEVYEAAGLVPHIDPGYYPSDWHMHRDDERYLTWVLQYASEFQDPQPGDIVLYQFGQKTSNPINARHTRIISHAAIVVEWPLVIHAVRGEGVVYGEGDRGAFDADRLVGFWRITQG